MKLEINATVFDDNGDKIVTETLSYDGNKSGVLHAVKPMGEALIYSVGLGLFFKKQVPVKDALGNVLTIAKDVVDVPAGEKP